MDNRVNHEFEQANKAMILFVEKLGEALAPVFDALIEFSEAIAKYLSEQIDWEAFDKIFTRIHPQRYEGESLVEWGNRLERAGIFDSYETRCMYGAECWRAMLHSPIWVVGKIWKWASGDED